MPENTQNYTYTQRLNDLLWEVSSIDNEANDDFSSITGILNSNDFFRSFGDGMADLILKKYPDAKEPLSTFSVLKTDTPIIRLKN